MCMCAKGNIMESKSLVTHKNELGWDCLADNLPKGHIVLRLDNLSLTTSSAVTATHLCDGLGRSLMFYFIIFFM